MSEHNVCADIALDHFYMWQCSVDGRCIVCGEELQGFVDTLSHFTEEAAAARGETL